MVCVQVWTRCIVSVCYWQGIDDGIRRCYLRLKSMKSYIVAYV
ncbi:hypothetical protein APHDU1_0481 [Anaplasma phagocytophilum]|nr:hypothetical protein OTSANNIE_1477 [Anaplasma phagocytophilum str. Annie]KJZ99797.1 hypothetical protein APHDU1_0481 [Anaplasma phagocytophilum]